MRGRVPALGRHLADAAPTVDQVAPQADRIVGLPWRAAADADHGDRQPSFNST